MVTGETYFFQDYYGNEVQLTLSHTEKQEQAKHVLVICSYQNKWLLTIHPKRGYEFPGGKVERGELPEDAAIREVYEETGGIVSQLRFIGQYKVIQRERVMIKNIYFATIHTLQKKEHYLETNGPVVINDLPNNIKNNDLYSFIMKDEVLTKALQVIKHEYMQTRNLP